MNRKTEGIEQEVERCTSIYWEVQDTIKVHCILKQMDKVTGEHTEKDKAESIHHP